jgi:exopolyphosphatase/guanosine-5'-triphosphate,3'-diphosphate pyrophosphatase
VTRVAVVDLGTNSTRLLVADVEGGEVREIERRTEITRLGQGVDATGALAEDAMERVFEAVAGFRSTIDELGATRAVAVATSAVRDAANGERLRGALEARYGLEARVIAGDEEARLTFRGATSALPVDGAEPTLVIDVGGGSTELVVGRAGGDPSFRVSTQAGSVRQTERHLHEDPPESRGLADLALEVQVLFETAVPESVRGSVAQGIAVAGTATSLAAVDLELEPYDAAQVDGYRLELGACERMLAMLAATPLPERRAVPGLHPGRAPTIVAGTVILVEAVRAFGLEAVRTSEADILHGAALAAAGA